MHLSPDGRRFVLYSPYNKAGQVESVSGRERVWMSVCDHPRWLPDNRRLVVGDDLGVNLYAFDSQAGHKLGVLLPSLPDQQYVCIGPEGHYRGSQRIEEHLVYVAQREDGSYITYTPEEFCQKFGWKNDPDKARFLALDPPDTTPPSKEPLHAGLAVEPVPNAPKVEVGAESATWQRGQPLSRRALVSQPATIQGLRSWSVELAGCEGSSVSSLEFSPDGRWIAVTDAGSDRNFYGKPCSSPRIRLYDRQCRLQRVLLGHEGIVAAASWSPDGRHLISTGLDKTVRFWDVAHGRLLRTLPLDVPGHAVRWSPNGQAVAVAGDGKAYVIDVRDGQRRVLGSARRWQSVAWSPNGHRLALAAADGFQVWQAEDAIPEYERRSPKGSLTHLAWSPDGRLLAGAHDDRAVTLWDAGKGEAKQKMEVPGHRPFRLAWSPKSDRLASVGNEPTAVWDVATGKLMMNGWLDTKSTTVSWSPDGQTLAIAPGGRLTILDAVSCGVRHQEKRLGHTKRVGTAAWSWDGKHLATGSDDQTAVICDATAGQVERKLEHPCAVLAVAWSHNGQWLTTGGADQRIRIWDAQQGTVSKTFDPLPAPLGNTEVSDYTPLAWNADDTLVAAALKDGSVMLVRSQPGEEHKRILKFEREACAVAWSPDGQKLLASSRDGFVGVWDAETDQGRYLDARIVSQEAENACWLGDSRTLFLGCLGAAVKQGYDLQENRRLGVLVPTVSGDQWLVVGPEGNYRGSSRIDEHLVYVVLTDDGRQETYTPAAFAAKFGWKNDPSKVKLTGEPSRAQPSGSEDTAQPNRAEAKP